jgi:hypothetical protein
MGSTKNGRDPLALALEPVGERVGVAVRDRLEPGRHRPEALAVVRLPGGGERAERAAVERPGRGQDDGRARCARAPA